MPEPGRDALADQRQFVVILRLVAGTTGDLLYGEVVDVDTGPMGRFVGWRGMTAAVRSWLAHELDDPPAQIPGAPPPGRADRRAPNQPAER